LLTRACASAAVCLADQGLKVGSAFYVSSEFKSANGLAWDVVVIQVHALETFPGLVVSWLLAFLCS